MVGSAEELEKGMRNVGIPEWVLARVEEHPVLVDAHADVHNEHWPLPVDCDENEERERILGLNRVPLKQPRPYDEPLDSILKRQWRKRQRGR